MASLFFRSDTWNKEIEAMKATLFAAAFLTIVTTASLAQNATSTEPTPTTQAQVKSLVRNAKTPADYIALHDYYAHAAEIDRAKAAEAKQEWERRSANPVAYGRKYPTPIDSAHYLYESYQQSADAAAAKAQRYQQLAESAH
jgi:hypothetical protein